MRALLILGLGPLLLTSCGKKKVAAPEVPKSGWIAPKAVQPDKQCYYPPNWESFSSNPRKLERSAALSGIVAQWRGERGDGVSLPSKIVTDVETVFFGDSAKVEAVALENAHWCERFHAGSATNAQWGEWVAGLASKLTAGECRGSLLPMEMHDYLNIGGEWHMPQPFCKGDQVVITSSNKDLYRVESDGPWITTAGDTSKPGTGDLPCTLEGCYLGTLLLRFRNYDGSIEQILPVGEQLIYRVPDHGTITVMINDDTFHDNEWKVEGGLQHHAGVSYLPK